MYELTFLTCLVLVLCCRIGGGNGGGVLFRLSAGGGEVSRSSTGGGEVSRSSTGGGEVSWSSTGGCNQIKRQIQPYVTIRIKQAH